MSWFKVDDGFHASKKLMRIPRSHRLACAGLWVISGSWSGNQLTDGFVPDYMLDEWGATPDMVVWLVESGLWETATDGAQFAKWEEYQPTKAAEDERKQKEAARKRDERARGSATAAANRNRPQTVRPDKVRTPAGQNPESVLPVPSRPDLTTPDGVVSAKRETGRSGTLIPASFRMTAEMLRWAQDNAPNVNPKTSTQKFVSHAKSVSGPAQFKTDWIEAWKSWLIGDQQKAADRPQQFKTSREKNLDAANGLLAKFQQKDADNAALAIEGLK